jgi:outer membrane protein assembly factor BamB
VTSEGCRVRTLRNLPIAAVVAGLLVACAGTPAPPRPASPPPTAVASGNHLAGFGLAPVPTTSPGGPTWTPWPAAMHDARHRGVAVGDGPRAGRVRWHRSLGAPVEAGPVLAADGTIYTATNAGVLHAVDPATGADRWTYDSHRSDPDDADLSVSALVLPDGTVLWGTPAHDLVALSPAGALLWTQPLPGRATSPATTDGRRVYVGDTGGGVSAIDVAAGGHRSAWTVDVGTTSYGSVVTDGSGRLYTTVDTALIALDDQGATARVAWRADPGDGISEVSAGLAADGTALLGTNGTHEWAYRRDGTPSWSAPAVITYSSPVVTADGDAYLADHAGRVRVVRAADGSEAASYQLEPPRQIWSSVAVDRARRVYFGTQQGHLLGVAPDGSVLFDLALGSPIDAYPALTADGALIVGDRDGGLTAVT